jgi:hypothetical protein
VFLWSPTQTNVGVGAKIQVTLGNGTIGNVKSNPFLVAAIPLTITMTEPQPKYGQAIRVKDKEGNDTGDFSVRWGQQYITKVSSDSEDVADLDQVTCKEKITPTSPLVVVGGWMDVGFGVAEDFNGTGLLVKTHLPPNTPTTPELVAKVRQSALLIILKGLRDGKFPAPPAFAQVYVFADKRTGVSQDHPVVVPNSGFQIVTEYVGQAVKVSKKGVEVDAGAAGIAAPGTISERDGNRPPVDFALR